MGFFVICFISWENEKKKKKLLQCRRHTDQKGSVVLLLKFR